MLPHLQQLDDELRHLALQATRLEQYAFRLRGAIASEMCRRVALLHDLRHTFATRLRAAGVHEMDIITLLRHTMLKVTQGYTHGVPKALRTAVGSREHERLLTFTPTSRQVTDNEAG